jgi:hypothetical protein
LYAEIRNMGGNDNDFYRILNGRTLIEDPTARRYPNLSESNICNPFWHTSVQWFIRRRDEISDDESVLIMQWSLHKHTEGLRGIGQDFSWKGRTARNTLERAIEYQQSLSHPRRLQYEWKSHNWDWSFLDKNNDKWEFKELTTGEALHLEGRAMQHCVASYVYRCTSGISAIVSIRFKNKHCITAELDPSVKRIVQLRGKYNRSATVDEQHIVSKWMFAVIRNDDKSY